MAIPLPFTLILASGSRGRRYLLEKAGYSFVIQPSNVDEPTEAQFGDCAQYVQQVAWLKAAAVAKQNQNGVVLAADSVGWIDGQVIGKPNDAAHAKQIIRQLAGRTHELWTGVCLWSVEEGFQLQWQELSRVYMKPFSETELEEYIATNLWVGCSGAYAIQEENDPYLTVLEGTWSNVVGLPLESLEKGLQWLIKCRDSGKS
jgi:septum formation protein